MAASATTDYDYLMMFIVVGDSAYYCGVMGNLMVYDVTNESTFSIIRNSVSIIELHALNEVNKILVGNKADMDESKRGVPTSTGQVLADEYGIKYFETVIFTATAVRHDKSKCGTSFFTIARDIKQMILGIDSGAECHFRNIAAAFNSSTLTGSLNFIPLLEPDISLSANPE